jgi:2,4-dienoyl-CoA reductase-like NADH-dependent reductase (Old Yellow Enzyme family)
MKADRASIFGARRIKNVSFANPLIRSSIGGRTAFYDGTVNDAWETFESRFAAGGVGGIISATLTVDKERWSPLEYPAISSDRYIEPLRLRIQRLKQRFRDLRYIIQVGDPGYHTQTSLVRQADDGMSASSGFDFLYGYTSFRKEMSVADIKATIRNFSKAARRVVATGSDGIELTASKGYLIHQFLNPGTNGRKDEYGGPLERRARLLKEVVEAIREAVGPDFLFGVRLSARDYNRSPWPAWLRFGPGLRPSVLSAGNGLSEMLEVGRWLEMLGVDYLHISSGFGFINPRENPGRFPAAEARMFCHSTSHLSVKSRLRALLLDVIPDALLNVGWSKPDRAVDFTNIPMNLDDAREFKRTVTIPVIVNGGFQLRSQVQQALNTCDFVSMARPLLANPDLPRLFQKGIEKPRELCTFCNRCAVRTTLFPLGCYEPERFARDKHGQLRTRKEADDAMQKQIERFNRPR